MRALFNLAIAPLAALTLRSVAHAQTAQQQSKCGVETWWTDKMMYVTTPCTSGTTEENPGGAQK